MPPTKKKNRNCVLHPKKTGIWFQHKFKHRDQLGQYLCKDCWDKANTGELDLMKLQRGELDE